MKEYYIADGKEQKGPYTIEELKNKKISATTLVWREGLNDWVEAKRLKELETLFKSTPPPLPKEDGKNITQNKVYDVNQGEKINRVKSKNGDNKITSQRKKIVIAKRLKFAGKIAFISILIGLISSVLFFYSYNGFKYISLKSKFESREYQSRIEKILNRLSEQKLKQEAEDFYNGNNESMEGGYYHPQLDDYVRLTGHYPNIGSYVNYTNILIVHCKIKIGNAIKKSIGDSLLVSLFVFLIIYLVIASKKGINWVAENSKKEI